MANKNKSVYEILEVSPNASYSEIQAAHQRLTAKLQSEYTGSNREDIDFRQRLIDVAFQSISYDAKMAKKNALTIVSAPVDIAAPPLNLDALSLKADALSLKADAMALKADAASIRAEVMSLRAAAPLNAITTTAEEHQSQSYLKMFFSAFTSLSSPFKKLLMLFGGFVASAMVLQVIFVMAAHRQMSHTTNEDAKLAEKVYLQEYYQKHGVRVASRAEAELLDAEAQRKESEQRSAELEKQRQDDEYRRFTEESRRIGNQVSDDLRRSEEAARQEEARQKQQELQKLEQQRRAIEEQERRDTEKARRKLGLDTTREPPEPPTYYPDPQEEQYQ